MAQTFRLVVKPGQEIEVLNPKLTKLAILGQTYINTLDDVACNKDVFNKGVKNKANLFLNEIDSVQRRIYNNHWANNRETFEYIETCTSRVIDLLTQISLEQFADVMGFLEIYDIDKKICLNFLQENAERINAKSEIANL